MAFIFYTINYYPEYMLLFPLFAFVLLITKFNTFSDLLYYKNISDDHTLKDKKKNTFEEKVRQGKLMKKVTKLYNIYTSLLDERARGTDFLILILLIDGISNIDITFFIINFISINFFKSYCTICCNYLFGISKNYKN